MTNRVAFLLLFPFFFSFPQFSVFAQDIQRKVDSLWQIVKKEKEDTSWIWSSLRLIDEIIHSQPDTVKWILQKVQPIVIRHWKKRDKEWEPLYYETGFRQAELLSKLHQKDSSLNVIQRLLTEAKKSDNHYYYAYSLLKRSLILERSGDIDKAIQSYKEVIQFLQESTKKEEKRVYGLALRNLGYIFGRKGNLQVADSLINQSLAIFTEIQEPKYICASYNALSVLYLWKGDYEKAKNLIKESLKISNEFNILDQSAISYANLGIIFHYTGSYDSAIYYLEKAIHFYRLTGDKKTIAKLLLNLGAVLDAQGNLYKAIDYQFQALELFEETKDSLGIAKCLTNVGGYYVTLGDYEKALEYYNRSAIIYKEKGYLRELAITYANIGEIYLQNKNFEEAKEFFEKSLELNKQIGSQRGISQNLLQIGLALLELGDKKKALSYFQQALQIAKKIDAKFQIIQAYKNIAKTYGALNRLYDALHYGNKAYKIAKSINHLESIRDISYILYQFNKQISNPQRALYFLETYIQIEDSLKNEANQRNMIRNEYKYKYEKEKALQEAKHAAELEKQRLLQETQRKRYQTFLLFLGIILTLSLIFSILLYNRYKIIQKQNRIIQEQKEEIEAQAEKLLIANDELQQQKEEILAQSEQLQALNELLQQQNEELNKKQKDIFDSIMYAKRIQRTILPSAELLQHYLQDYCLLYLPHTIVSGDFYFFKITDHYYYIAVGDCTGHGVPGAMVSLTCHRVLEELIGENPSISPGDLLTRAREKIIQIFHSSSAEHYSETLRDGMDIAIIRLEKENPLHCSFAGAYNPLYLFTQNSFQYSSSIPFTSHQTPFRLFEIKGDRQPVGFIENPKPFQTHSFHFPPDAIICLFSDGFPSQFGGQHGKKLGYKNFKSLLLKLIETTPSLHQMEENLHHVLLSWQGNYPQIDDITVMCFKPILLIRSESTSKAHLLYT